MTAKLVHACLCDIFILLGEEAKNNSHIKPACNSACDVFRELEFRRTYWQRPCDSTGVEGVHGRWPSLNIK